MKTLRKLTHAGVRLVRGTLNAFAEGGSSYAQRQTEAYLAGWTANEHKRQD